MRDEFDQLEIEYRKPPVPGLAVFTGVLWVLLGMLFLLFGGLNGIVFVFLAAALLPSDYRIPHQILPAFFCNAVLATALSVGLFITGLQTILGTNKRIKESSGISLFVGLICLAAAAAELILFGLLPAAVIVAGLGVGLLFASGLGYVCSEKYNERWYTTRWYQKEIKGAERNLHKSRRRLQTAAILWIVFGLLTLGNTAFVLALSFAGAAVNSAPAGKQGSFGTVIFCSSFFLGLFGLFFIVVGLQYLQGKESRRKENAIGSVLLGAVFLIVGIVQIIVGSGTDLPAAIVLSIIPLASALAFIAAGVLAEQRGGDTFD